MRWIGRRESTQVEDRRGMRAGGPRLAVGGCGTIIVVLVISWLTGTDPMQLLQLIGGGGGPVAVDSTAPGESGAPVQSSPEEEKQIQFAKVVLADTEETWSSVFAQRGQRYQLPTLVFFRDAVNSACGLASTAVGPFYCPSDGKLYLDLEFFSELDRRFGAPGDFAQAYVIAHEIGHHVQKLLGIADQVTAAQERARSQEEANALSVRLELQADCLAGVWVHNVAQRNLLDNPDEINEALNAASAVGDDRIQSQAGMRVDPDSFTHGTSEQRRSWFNTGFQSGNSSSCDTFSQ